MFVDLQDAADTAAALDAAAKAIPLVHVSAGITNQASEWACAVAILSEMGDAYGITLLSTVMPGMRIANPNRKTSDQYASTTARRAASSQSGGWYLHYNDPDGRDPRGLYENYAGPQSPVVVWRGPRRLVASPLDDEYVDAEIVDDGPLEVGA